ncbi:MAG: bifunctional phosphoribosylaminoimidazolecarboxamide formyltransferase/IMP cyclohydrolase [Anaerolineae bacterium]
MRAILSVYDKTDIDLLGRGLTKMGFEIYSTGGTARALHAAGVRVQSVSDLTGFPEILGGRVKTLHPAIYGGILARRHMPADLDDLARHGLPLVDLVAVNLYPFAETVARPNISLEEALEQIDIGGPTLLRAAAKNFPAVAPLCDPADYPLLLEELRKPGGPDQAFRRRLAGKAFRHTAVYDSTIAAYLGAEACWPEEMPLGLRKVQDLRYGENPHQQAAFYAPARPGQNPVGLVAARQLQGKELSYNNILDADAAWAVASDFHPITIAIVKHMNPCGLAWAEDPLTAYHLALDGDPRAAFGGIVAINTSVDHLLAQQLVRRFYEIVLAPDFSAEARQVLASRPNLRVLKLPFCSVQGLTWRSVGGGLLAQQTDWVEPDEVRRGQVVTRRTPTEEEWAALDFAWRAVRHVKSNAIVLVQNQEVSGSRSLALVGMGAGQPSRVAAVELAVRQAGPRAKGAVLASDAFFPMPDGVETAAQAGVRAIVQPGGSQGDREVIAAADAASMTMVFTGKRHFLH